MKRIKIILGIIIAFAVIFLSTGLIFKETAYTTQVEVHKPLAEVFSVFNDSSKINNWIPELKSIEPIDVKPEKTGSTYKMVVSDPKGQEITLREKIMAFVPNEKVTLFFNTDVMFKKDDYTFNFNNGVTTITNNSICRGNSYLFSCVLPYFKSKIKEQDQEHLNNFKSFIEKN
ncbi:SRPBCC family protein [Tenacibaculum sp. 190524A05c]|uniref:SRPBCC family protein n=1 Tax=Tenacibaculum platacis TaxID=3137852 RepID=UPI0032B276E4